MNPRQKFKLKQLFSKVTSAWKPPEKLSTREWVKRHMRMPSEKAQGGKVVLDDNPVIPLLVDIYDDPSIQLIYVMASARTGKSFSTMCFVGQEMTTGGRRQILEGWPNDNMIRKYIFGDFRDMTRNTAPFKGIIEDENDEKKAGTYKIKRYKNGANLISANMTSSNDMSGVDAGIVIVHEWDRIPSTTGNDGSTDGQIMARTQAQWQKKVIFESTPTIENGPIHTGYLLGTQHEPYFFFTCCEQWEPIRFEDKTDLGEKAGVSWLTNDDNEILPDTAMFICRGCGEMHNNDALKKIIRQKGENNVKLVAKYPERKIVSVHAGWIIMTPFGKLVDIVRDYAKAIKQGPAALTAFYNLIAGQPYSIPGSKIDPNSLLARIVDRPKLVVPKGCVMVTAGVDVQLKFLAVQIIAWAEDERKFILDYREIDGDTSKEDVWTKLFTFLNTDLETEYSTSGYHVTMPVEAVCIDTGGANTHYYYQQLRDKRPKYIAIKGSSTFNAPLYKRPRLQDINHSDGKTIEKGIELNEVGVSQGKVYLYGQLATAISPVDKGYTCFGAFLKPDYFKGLTSEKLMSSTDPRTGKQKYEWKKIINRNEVLDTFLYAHVAYKMTVGMADEYLDYNKRMALLMNQTRLDQTKIEDPKFGQKVPLVQKKKEARIACKVMKNNIWIASEKKRMHAGDMVDLLLSDYIIYASKNAVAPIDSDAQVHKVMIEQKAQAEIDAALEKKAHDNEQPVYYQPTSFLI